EDQEAGNQAAPLQDVLICPLGSLTSAQLGAIGSVLQAALDKTRSPRPARDVDGPTPRIQPTLKKRLAADPEVPVIPRLSSGSALAATAGDDPENRVSV